MEKNNYIPIIEVREDCDRHGRNISVGVKRNRNEFTLPSLSVEELVALRDEIEKYLKEN